MQENFVQYLEKSNLFQSVESKNNNHPAPLYDAQLIENLTGYTISSLVNLSEKRKAKIINVLESHLKMLCKKAARGSHQYNSNRHISLLQALVVMRPKKTQPK